MKRFRLTPRAAQDLVEIIDYIFEASGADRAEAMRRALLDAARRLAEMPGMGHSREDLTDEPVLFWSVFSYFIVYRPETEPLEVVRFVSGRRDLNVDLKHDLIEREKTDS